MVVLLSLERAFVECLERDSAAEAENRQKLMSESREMSETASRQLAENGEWLQEIQLKVTTVTPEVCEWHALLNESVVELKVAKADVSLLSKI